MDNVDRCGNRVAFFAVRAGPCTGFVRGRWARMTPRGGVFGGSWVSGTGCLRGHLRGIWGVTSSGDPVLHGVVIDRQGQVVARLRGAWDDFHFKAEWIRPNGVVVGSTRGRYWSPPGIPGRGGFGGLWDLDICCAAGDPTCAGPADGDPASSDQAP